MTPEKSGEQHVVLGAIQARTHLEEHEKQAINNKQVTPELIAQLKQRAITKYEELIAQAAAKGVHILGLPELFAGPFFPAVPQNKEQWTAFAEADTGLTIQKMQAQANKHNMVLIVPFYEEENNQQGKEYYNTAAVIDADGMFLGKYQKIHIPYGWGFNEQDYFAPGNTGLPVFETKHGKVGIYICFDRHFGAGFSMLKERGADIIFVPAATVTATSEYIWEAEARVRAYDNKLYVVAINRVGHEGLGGLKDTHFYGSSMIINPRGQVVSKGSRTENEIVHASVEIQKSIEEAQQRYPTRQFTFAKDKYLEEPRKQTSRTYKPN
jgi:beta-ureidopropionase